MLVLFCTLLLTLVDIAAFLPVPDGSFVIGPPYTVDPALTPQGNNAGRFFSFNMNTSLSKVFNGTSPTFANASCSGETPGECCHKTGACEVNALRNISVYIPWNYVDGTAAPVLVMQDGPSYLQQVAYALDNLAPSLNQNRSLAPFIAVSIENGGSDAIKSERGLEYDTMSDRYARFVALEVLPAVQLLPDILALYPNFAISGDPTMRAAMGCSSGGAAALTMAWMRPDLFRRVIAYSATLVDQQDHDDGTGAFAQYPLGAWEYHSGEQLITTTSPPKPLRIFHNSNEFDLGYNLTAAPVNSSVVGLNNTDGDPNNWTDGHHNWATAGNRTSEALQAAGYTYRYVHALGLGHCDSQGVLQTLADTLVWLWQDEADW